MSDSPWLTKTISELGSGNASTVQTGPFGSQLHADDYVEEGVPFILIRNIGDSGLKAKDLPRISFSDAKRLAKYSLNPGDIVFSRVGRTGSCLLATDAEAGWIISGQTLRLRLDNPELDSHFLLYALRSHAVQNFVSKSSVGTTRESLNTKILQSIPVLHPRYSEQERIAEILLTVDEAIEQTEALIAKYQQIKAGLMHDLFTRGVTPDGHLRPTRAQAPHLYKESPLGKIPKEWETVALSNVADSLVDGPFGSNLKTEHYVVEPGVRVVRLQNIQEGGYNDEDRAFVSKRHAAYLVRHTVNPGDVLVAALGEGSYPVGRACCYPDDLPPAVNKADCYRLRCKSEFALNAYVMHFLNTANARKQVRRFEQGVTRRRMNLGNFRRVVVSQPTIKEQKRILDFLSSASGHIESAELLVTKLCQQKHGLMHDLLTGRVRVEDSEVVLGK